MCTCKDRGSHALATPWLNLSLRIRMNITCRSTVTSITCISTSLKLAAVHMTSLCRSTQVTAVHISILCFTHQHAGQCQQAAPTRKPVAVVTCCHPVLHCTGPPGRQLLIAASRARHMSHQLHAHAALPRTIQLHQQHRLPYTDGELALGYRNGGGVAQHHGQQV